MASLEEREFGTLLYEAVLEAIQMMGVEEFRKTSFFGSNHRGSLRKRLMRAA